MPINRIIVGAGFALLFTSSLVQTVEARNIVVSRNGDITISTGNNPNWCQSHGTLEMYFLSNSNSGNIDRELQETLAGFAAVLPIECPSMQSANFMRVINGQKEMFGYAGANTQWRINKFESASPLPGQTQQYAQRQPEPTQIQPSSAGQVLYDPALSAAPSAAQPQYESAGNIAFASPPPSPSGLEYIQAPAPNYQNTIAPVTAAPIYNEPEPVVQSENYADSSSGYGQESYGDDSVDFDRFGYSEFVKDLYYGNSAGYASDPVGPIAYIAGITEVLDDQGTLHLIDDARGFVRELDPNLSFEAGKKLMTNNRAVKQVTNQGFGAIMGMFGAMAQVRREGGSISDEVAAMNSAMYGGGNNSSGGLPQLSALETKQYGLRDGRTLAFMYDDDPEAFRRIYQGMIRFIREEL